jgi:hypothetical protein
MMERQKMKKNNESGLSAFKMLGVFVLGFVTISPDAFAALPIGSRCHQDHSCASGWCAKKSSSSVGSCASKAGSSSGHTNNSKAKDKSKN